jgi:hypothetical protein
MLCWNNYDKGQERVNKKENQSFNKLTKSKDLLLRNVTLKEKIHLLGCYAALVGTASFS